MNEVARILDAHPTIHTLNLNSIGGRVQEAKKLGQLIKQRELVTYASSKCFSACTVAFMGGAERGLRQGAKLGFHAFQVPGNARARENAKRDGIEFYVDQGVDRKFAERAFETPTTQMWYPTFEELQAARVVTAMWRASSLCWSSPRRPSSPLMLMRPGC